ncbi:chorion peroxidase-like [Watersipora subatra]|uniref:chorion peroxidase-like n=1 Tax=Watersipora subatra TaxID=2589382 RepID=UPI00355B6054
MMSLLFTCLYISCLFGSAWAKFGILEYRHSIHLTVNEPDYPQLSLSSLERIANSYIDELKGQSNNLVPKQDNPYDTEPLCEDASVYRTIDGTCNNLVRRWYGAAKTPLGRMTLHRYQDGFNAPTSQYFFSPGELPTARQVSTGVLTIRSNRSARNTHLLMSFGQFLDHDFALSPESGGEGGQEEIKAQCCEVPVSQHVGNLSECLPIFTPNDPVFKRTCIPFLRSAPIPPFPGDQNIRHQLNDLTAFIDGSQIYGSTNLKAISLREFVGGRLKAQIINSEESLPSKEDNPSSCPRKSTRCEFVAGDIRSNEQATLTSMHTLFLREHNRIANKLSSLNNHWSDEKVYQETRKIVGGILQRLTYAEWLPVIVGKKLMKHYGLAIRDQGRFNGYLEHVDPSIATEFSTVAFRFGHSLVRQTFSRSSEDTISLNQIFDSFRTIHRHGSNALMKGLVQDPVEEFDRYFSKGLRNKLFGAEADLLSFNINRGRDHGVASYQDIRRYLGLTLYPTYTQMVGKTHSLAVLNDLEAVYPSTLDIEAFPGGVSELPMEGAVVGETFAHIISEQFFKLKFGDRFWHESPNTETGFKTDQLQEIRKISFAAIFCNNIVGVQVRKQLLHLESYDNPKVSCDLVPKMDLSKWKEKTS